MSSDFKIYQARTFDSVVFEYKNAAGAAINLTGYTAKVVFKSPSGTVTEIVSGPSSGDRVILDAANGKITPYLTYTTTADFVAGTYIYDVIIYNSTEVVEIRQGEATCEATTARK